MESRYNKADAARCRENYPSFGADLADRVYTSRLLGSDASLVLHGGGNTSVKSHACGVDGERVEVLWVKGSGWDLGTIEPQGFAVCRLEALKRYCRLPALSDEAMVSGLRSQMLDPFGPTPSVEALLHAHLPGKFVDHTHADAVLSIVDQPDAADRAANLWGKNALFLPYVPPGFVLAQRIVELGVTEQSPPLIILERHGIFTWGDTAEESYERMISAVAEAERYVKTQRRTVPAAVATLPSAAALDRARATLSPVLRGAIARADEGQSFVIHWRDTPAIQTFLGGPEAHEVASRGCITPDHSIRTKPFPAWLRAAAAGSPASLDLTRLTEQAESCVRDFGQQYCQYFSEHSHRSPTPLTRLDPLPRIVAVPGLGIAALGKTLAQAKVAADLYEHAAAVMSDAESIGSYRPVNPAELFDVEYWSLEQAKLGKRSKGAPLDGHIALVTGAASGIGLATATHFLSLGAHLVLVDRDAQALDTAVRGLEGKGPGIASYVADLTDPAAAHAAIETAALKFGGLDIVVSNAGSAPGGALHDAEGTERLEGSLSLNLLSHQHVARAAAELFLRQGTGGCLLFNASKSAFNPGPLFGPYAVAKAALVALMKQYAIDLASAGVRSNAVNADRIRTGLFSKELLEARAAARGTTPDAYFRANLLHRETSAHDVAQAFAYLATAGATTGAILPVDGGNAAAFPR